MGKKVRLESVEVGVKFLYNAFNNVSDLVEVLCPGVQIPNDKMNSKNVVVKGAIISDEEE